jgi:hypothetical protein
MYVVNDIFMAKKIAITLIILLVAIAAVPSTVAGLGIDEVNWDQKFNDDSDDYGPLVGENENLKEVYVNETDTKVRFRANISGGNDGLNNDDALQVYIDSDTDVETGLNDDTVSGGTWAEFYDGVGTMGADYRISVRDGGTPIIQEHDTGALFDTITSIEMEETGKSVMLEIDKETIGDPETFDAKFAYVADPGTSDVQSADYVWAPDAPIRFADSVETIGTATVDASVEFGDESVDNDATVVFELRDDGETVDTIENSTFSGSGTLTETFTVNNDTYNGQVELAVDVQDDDDYSLDRENINNTVEITSNGLDEDDKKSGKVALSLIEAEVNFGSEDPDDDASVEFSLTDDEPSEVAAPTVTDVTDTTTQTFTVNPNDFNDEGKLKVDVLNDDDYPYSETKGVDGIKVGSSLTDVNKKTFDADTIGHDFTLDPEGDSTVNIETNDGFTTNVSLESNTEGSNVTSVTHVMNYDSANLNGSDISVDVNNTFSGQNYTIVKGEDVVDEAGKYGIEIYTINNFADNPVVGEGENQHLYQIELNFSDGLQEELSQGTNVIEFTPTTADRTELFNQTDGETPLSYTSSTNSVGVKNTETRITNAEITHRTDGGVMENVTAEIRVSVESNEGKLANITLNQTDGSAFPRNDANDKHVIECSESSCESLSGELRYTPTEENATEATGGGYTEEPFFNITARHKNGDVYTLSDYDSTVSVKVYRFGDVAVDANGKYTVETADVRAVIQNRGEGDGTLPWDDDGLARSDLNNNGEITIADVTKIVEEYDP